MLGRSNTDVAAIIANEELVNFGQVTDVVLALAHIPGVVASDDFDVLQLGSAFIGITHKAQAVVFEVGEGVDDRLGDTMVGVFPIVEDSLHAQTEVASKVL